MIFVIHIWISVLIYFPSQIQRNIVLCYARLEEASIRKTIMVMDSYVKSLNTRLIEEELGGLLFRGQFSCERRAYNSGEWPRAKFPKIKISNQFFP